METLVLDKNYVGKFKVGNQEVKMMALLNLGATVVTANNCTQCQTKVYDISGVKNPVY